MVLFFVFILLVPYTVVVIVIDDVVVAAAFFILAFSRLFAIEGHTSVGQRKQRKKKEKESNVYLILSSFCKRVLLSLGYLCCRCLSFFLSLFIYLFVFRGVPRFRMTKQIHWGKI